MDADEQIRIRLAEADGCRWIWGWGADNTTSEAKAVKRLELRFKSEGYDYDPSSECQKRMKGLFGEQTLATESEIKEAMESGKYTCYYYYNTLDDPFRVINHQSKIIRYWTYVKLSILVKGKPPGELTDWDMADIFAETDVKKMTAALLFALDK